MRPFATPAAPDCFAALPLADFADAFALDVAQAIDAPQATAQTFARLPGWISGLVWFRNLLVAPFGLSAGAGEALPAARRHGMFPILSSTPGRVVMGFDDRHLDFRIVVDVNPVAAGHRVTVTTLVQRHALSGRLYLAVVMPFHKRIVPALLARVAGG